MTETINSTLKQDWETLKTENPNMRIRQAAAELGVSEAELLATTVGKNTVRLQGPWPEMLKRFKDLGYVMSLTRNDTCVLEHKGVFEEIDIVGGGAHKVGTVIGPIETRVFFSGWAFAFANTMDTGRKVMKNIQVFDKSGEAVTKIYLQGNRSNEEAYNKLVEEFKAVDQYAPIDVEPYEDKPLTDHSEVNTESLLEGWRNLKDTHDFFPLIGKHKVHRFSALEIAEGEFTRRIDNNAIKTILEHSSEKQLPIMIFAGNRGNLQIHQDVVKKIIPMNRGGQDWINVMDPEFNLHLRKDMIAHSWVVKKPTVDGDVTAVELFDENHTMIAQIFGLRKPGIPEREDWRSFVNTLR